MSPDTREMIDPASDASTARKPIRAPRGSALSCRGWEQEAALRLLMNGFDPDVAEYPTIHFPDKFWDRYDIITGNLRKLENDQTLIVRPHEPPEIHRANAQAPRYLVVGATEFGNWLEFGLQANLSIAYENYAAAARKHFGATLAGKLVVAGGMGRTGGAHGLAAALNGGAFLGIEVDPDRIKRRVKTGLCDVMVNDLDESLRILKNAVRKREAASVGLVGNCAEVFPQLAERGIVPDLFTDLTSANAPVNAYVPIGLDVISTVDLKRKDPEEYRRRSGDSVAAQVRAALMLQKLGSLILPSGNYNRSMPGGGLVPLEWVALSGETSDIYRIDQMILEMFPGNKTLTQWIRVIQRRVRFQGLPSRAGWFAPGEQAKLGLALNGLVAGGELKSPIAMIEQRMDIDSLIGSPETDSPPEERGTTAGAGPSWLSFLDPEDAAPGAKLAKSRGFLADGTPEMAARMERSLA